MLSCSPATAASIASHVDVKMENEMTKMFNFAELTNSRSSDAAVGSDAKSVAKPCINEQHKPKGLLRTTPGFGHGRKR